jgi:chemotaxis protein CheX
MKVQLVNAYIAGALDVLGRETGGPVERGAVHVQASPHTTEDVTAVIGISGGAAGALYLSMSEETALAVVSRLLGEPFASFDEFAASGIAELANVVAGGASIALSDAGVNSMVSPPLLLAGAGVSLASFGIQRLMVPVSTSCGPMTIHVALR